MVFGKLIKSSRLFQNNHFSDFVDKQTGYTTINMLATPVLKGKEVLAVFMALNKKNATEFSKEDEEVSADIFFFNALVLLTIRDSWMT